MELGFEMNGLMKNLKSHPSTMVKQLRSLPKKSKTEMILPKNLANLVQFTVHNEEILTIKVLISLKMSLARLKTTPIHVESSSMPEIQSN